MGVFIALYRGLNVGGRHAVKMESLRAMHERLAHRNVKSYIQSGNVVFSASGSYAAIARKLTAEFITEFSFTARVVVVTAKLAAENPKSVHAGICEGEPNKKELTALLTKTGGTESLVIGKELIYLHAPDGLGTSKFAAGMEKACGVPMTARNWRTMEALWKLASAIT